VVDDLLDLLLCGFCEYHIVYGEGLTHGAYTVRLFYDFHLHEKLVRVVLEVRRGRALVKEL
jgi:hypothetical protein